MSLGSGPWKVRVDAQRRVWEHNIAAKRVDEARARLPVPSVIDWTEIGTWAT